MKPCTLLAVAVLFSLAITSQVSVQYHALLSSLSIRAAKAGIRKNRALIDLPGFTRNKASLL
jgi:hypothetical protein